MCCCFIPLLLPVVLLMPPLLLLLLTPPFVGTAVVGAVDVATSTVTTACDSADAVVTNVTFSCAVSSASTKTFVSHHDK
jgi:hypothetical protein